MAQIHNATLKVMGGGRVTIPCEIRELEDIEVGCFVRITIEKLEATVNAGKSRIEKRPKVEKQKDF